MRGRVGKFSVNLNQCTSVRNSKASTEEGGGGGGGGGASGPHR